MDAHTIGSVIDAWPLDFICVSFGYLLFPGEIIQQPTLSFSHHHVLGQKASEALRAAKFNLVKDTGQS